MDDRDTQPDAGTIPTHELAARLLEPYLNEKFGDWNPLTLRADGLYANAMPDEVREQLSGDEAEAMLMGCPADGMLVPVLNSACRR